MVASSGKRHDMKDKTNDPKKSQQIKFYIECLTVVKRQRLDLDSKEDDKLPLFSAHIKTNQLETVAHLR